jgi:putative ABC transport system permease protein
VIAIIQGMNAYVKENVANAMIGSNTFQVRRTPINIGLIEDEHWRRMQRRPKISHADAEVVRAALPDAEAISITSGWPTPQSDVVWHNRTLGDVLIFGVSPEHQVVQDYRFSGGEPLNEIDVRQRRNVVVIGADVAKKLFEEVDPVGREIRIRGELFRVTGVVAPKGRVLGQSFDGFVMMPITTFESIYGLRQTTTISVKMPTALEVSGAMAKAEEAMRVAHRLRPGEEPDFSIETADALIAFWKQLTAVLFSVVPAMVAIGIVVGGIVIMNIMLMSVKERTHEIGLRKSVGATHRDISRQFLAEATMLATIGGAMGAVGGWMFATMISAASPLPARVTLWSIFLALALGAGVGVLFGVYPATRAARLDPVNALRAE